ncbi:hypothetical protein DNH61_15415 [Paenibacillus sambharensis]|uniref:Uncharacterized protein n=1 Tax=Paenibacillus sambharensis TaxID=1803190 RepID=A0A2W1L6Y3_9BACL|nr:hypothetical protein [Paenibacillus sambharensis]PZD95026.1 hypothetical protein DNH61_15415 [Paenibacillus sambharensis]
MIATFLRGFISILIVVGAYYGFARYYGASFEGVEEWPLTVGDLLLLSFSVLNIIQIKRVGGLILYFIWIGISTIPNILIMRDMRYREESGGGWISFPWDWLLWSNIYIIYILSQVVFWIGTEMYLKYRIKKQSGSGAASE